MESVAAAGSDPAPFSGSGSASSELAESRKRESRQSLLSYPATYALIGVNVAVFAAMIPFGPLPELMRHHAYGSILTAAYDPAVLERFGSSSPYMVLQYHQWWRLITSMFVHVMPLHLLVNMWCLWNLGLFAEPLLGQAGLVAVYLLTGAAGMLQSLAFGLFTQRDAVTAGASGAIFGIAGILIVLLSNRKLSLPWDELRSLRRQVIFFAIANLAIGLAPAALPMFSARYLHAVHINSDVLPHIDNSAHVGGFLWGLALGWPLLPRMTSGRSSYRMRQGLVFSSATVVLLLLARMVSTFWRG